MAITIVLDTNIILLQLGGSLAEEIPRGRFFVSAISEIELLSYHSLSSDEESLVRQFLSEMTIVDLNASVKAETIRIRKENRIKIPDANCCGYCIGFERRIVFERSCLSSYKKPSMSIT